MTTDATPNLDLPYIMPSQAQKHVTHNESLRIADALIHLSVEGRSATVPPISPTEGERHIVAAAASGAWAGHAGQIASFQDGVWFFHVPKAGWRCWVEDEGVLCAHDGTQWSILVGPKASLEDLTQLGVNTVADATNRIAVKSDAILFSHDDITPGSGDARIKLNKSAAGQTASLILQDGFSGRAEIGLAGDDDLRIKVSSDGATWREALRTTATSGSVSFPSGARFDGTFGVGRAGIATGGLYFHRNPDSPFILYSAGDPSTPTEIGQIRASSLLGVIGMTNPAVSWCLACNVSTMRVGIKTITPSNVLSVEGIAAPETDNAYSCGTATKRWSTVYAATGTINTSDARDKSVEGPLGEAAARIVDAVQPVFFRWIEGSRERVGANEGAVLEGLAESKDFEIEDASLGYERSRPGIRRHAGWLAQQVKAAFDTEGLDCGAWGLDNPDDPQSRQWLRPDELTALLWETVRQTRAELRRLREQFA